MSPPSPSVSDSGFFARVDAALLQRFRNACNPFDQKDVLTALLRAYLDDTSFYNRVRRGLLDSNSTPTRRKP